MDVRKIFTRTRLAVFVILLTLAESIVLYFVMCHMTTRDIGDDATLDPILRRDILLFALPQFGAGLLVAALIAVVPPLQKPLRLSYDVWVLLGLLVALGTSGLLSIWGRLSPAATYALAAILIGVAVALMVRVRARRGWRWPGVSAGHLLAAGAAFVWGASVSASFFHGPQPDAVILLVFPACLVCYILRLVAARADEFDSACRPDAAPQFRPSVPLTALILVLTVGTAVMALLLWPGRPA